MADLGDSGKAAGRVPLSTNMAADRQSLLRHMRAGRRPLAQKMDAVYTAALERSEAQARPTLEEAETLVANTAIAPRLRGTFVQTRTAYTNARQQGDHSATTARLGEHKRAAVNLINGAKAAEVRGRQLADQAALHADMAPVLGSVKTSSFPQGQAANIESTLASGAGTRGKAVPPDPQFKAYLTQLAELEEYKAAAQKNKGGTVMYGTQLQQKCQALVAAADAYLAHHEQDLDPTQKQDPARVSQKRYCEEGRLSGYQYLIALDFDALGDPKASPDGWDEAAEMRAAGVRAKLSYHEAYRGAVKLGDSGDKAGASESRWLQGADWDATGQAIADQPGAGAHPAVAVDKRVAIFKSVDGEKAPDGMRDKPGAGAIKEALACANAKLFAAQTGIDLGVPETHVVAINRYAVQGDDSGSPLDLVVGSSQFNAGAKNQLADMPGAMRDRIKPRDIQKMAMLDVMQLNCDRHGGNVMVKFDDHGEPVLVPIDHGASMPTRADFGAVKKRIGGLDRAGWSTEIFNALLKLPAAYEPFDPELLAGLELLEPAAIEGGVKRQRDAMDQVHPGLGANDKVPDDSLHLSRRAMMFMKKAAPVLSPAEVQIALAQRGEELFDADDKSFDAVADRIIADCVPMGDAYKALLTGPNDQLHAMLEWLQRSGWVLDGKDGAVEFLMRDPVLALKLFRAQQPNANPMKPQALPKPPEEPAVDATQRTVSDAFKQEYQKEFPAAKMDVDAKNWLLREHYWEQMIVDDEFPTYDQILLDTGADHDKSIKDVVDACAVWAELNKDANATLRASLQPNGQGTVASAFLRAFLKAGLARAAAVATAAQAQAVGGPLDDDTGVAAAAEACLDRLSTLRADPLFTQAVDPISRKVLEVRLELNKQRWDSALQMAQALERAAQRAALEALAALAKSEVDALMKRWAEPKPPADVQEALGGVIEAGLTKNSLLSAREALTPLRQAIATYNTYIDDALGLVPAFSWDARDASTAKKAAVNARLFKDKDTGLSDALKAVAVGQKAYDDVEGSKVRMDKKRPGGDKAIAAYQKFIPFVNAKLRPLSDQPPWTYYCDSAVKAANRKIAFIRSVMANWP